MKSVISASRRTDIPAYYLKWFMDSLGKGSIEVANPLYRHKKTVVNLSSDWVEWIVFWSRNYTHFLKNYSFFDAYQLFFHFTIVSGNPKLERTIMSLNQVLKQVENLSKIYGPERIIWRYDPIVIWLDKDTLNSNYKQSEFSFLSHNLCQMGIKNCYFSFVTNYGKFVSRIKKKYPDWILVHTVIDAAKKKILDEMKHIAYNSGLRLFTCCNDSLIDEQIKKGSCISGSLLNNLGSKNKVSVARAPSRPDCGCSRSVDIGDYLKHPCYSGCIYCYANPVWDTKAIKHPDT